MRSIYTVPGVTESDDVRLFFLLFFRLPHHYVCRSYRVVVVHESRGAITVIIVVLEVPN